MGKSMNRADPDISLGDVVLALAISLVAIASTSGAILISAWLLTLLLPLVYSQAAWLAAGVSLIIYYLFFRMALDLTSFIVAPIIGLMATLLTAGVGWLLVLVSPLGPLQAAWIAGMVIVLYT